MFKSLLALFILGTGIAFSNAGTISDSLKGKLNSGEPLNAILELPSIHDKVLSNPVLSLLSGASKGNMVNSLLQKATQVSQAPFLSAINNMGLAKKVQSFWVSNDIALKGVDPSVIKTLAKLPGSFTLREEDVVNLNPVVVRKVNDQDNGTTLFRTTRATAQWGVEKIGAPTVWSRRNSGEGIIVANIDSGVRGDHESLVNNYAGRWYDPAEGDSSPTDNNGHGTHTMGSILGTKYGIGVAPKARWIACKGLDGYGRGYESWMKACGQWVQEQRPHVVSNSWGGGQGRTAYNDMIRSWRAADIIPVFSAGNSGPDCGTANSPADQPNLISVGSTKSDDTLSDFSSRGPSVQGYRKPEVSAPGDQIPSAYINSPSSYVYMSGTSMACPHVAGAIALMLSDNPYLSFDQIYEKLRETASRPSLENSDSQCGNTGNRYPNNAYGYGRINVAAAMGL